MDLKEFGINEVIKIEGDYKIISQPIDSSIPIVFLIDEHHGNKNNCITKNIQNAKKLISKANVVLVGVESLAGGRLWEEDDYLDEDENPKFNIEAMERYVSDCRIFEKAISKEFKNVKGVECEGIMHVVRGDLVDKKFNDITEHPLNKQRTRHFISTLFFHLNGLETKGNVILNCGSDHNNHIEEWIRNGEIYNITGKKANYIRLNAID